MACNVGQFAYLGAEPSVSVVNCKSFFSDPFEVAGSPIVGFVSSMVGFVSSVSMFISERFARFASRPGSSSAGDADRSRFTDDDAVEGVGTGSLSDDIAVESSSGRTMRIYDPLPAASKVPYIKGWISMKGKGWRIRRGIRKEVIHGRGMDKKDVRVKEEGGSGWGRAGAKGSACGRAKMTVG